MWQHNIAQRRRAANRLRARACAHAHTGARTRISRAPTGTAAEEEAATRGGEAAAASADAEEQSRRRSDVVTAIPHADAPVRSGRRRKAAAR